MQLINEQDDAPFGAFDLVQNRLQALFKLAAVFRAGDQSAHVEGENGLVLQGFRHVAAHDPLRQALGNGSLADTGFADQDGVILCLSGQNTDNVSDFIVPADDRVGFLFSRLFDKVCAVLFQCLIGAFGIVGRHALTAANAL